MERTNYTNYSDWLLALTLVAIDKGVYLDLEEDKDAYFISTEGNVIYAAWCVSKCKGFVLVEV